MSGEVNMKVAFTSSNGTRVDQHFGKSDSFTIWEIGPASALRVGDVPASPSSVDQEDKITARAEALTGCTLVVTLQIGGPAAAKLVARRIHPMKTGGEVEIQDLVAQLQEVLRRPNPPPWLKRAMGSETGCIVME